YKRLAFGHDQLMPVSGGFSEFFDDAHPVGLTIVEALDTLFFMGLDDEVAMGVAWIRDHLDFHAVAQPVQIFETNIRMVGGLLSGYLATGETVLLAKAKDIADILLPAFQHSPTGAPYRFVNPSTGEPREHLWFARVDMNTGVLGSLRQVELTAFYAGLLGQAGNFALGNAYLDSWTSLLSRYRVLPEVVDPLSGVATGKGNALRPEYVDSCFNLWLLTRNDRYRRLAFAYYLRQKADSRVPNGWTVIDDVTTTPATHGDLTSGYWYSEQMKYWYLMFSGTNRFDYRNNYLSTEGNVFRGVRRPR